MQYRGKLYGKIGRRQIPLTMTSDDVDAMEAHLKRITQSLQNVPQRYSLEKIPSGCRATWHELVPREDGNLVKWDDVKHLFEPNVSGEACREKSNDQA